MTARLCRREAAGGPDASSSSRAGASLVGFTRDARHRGLLENLASQRRQDDADGQADGLHLADSWLTDPSVRMISGG